VGDHRRADASCEVGAGAQHDADARQHHCQSDVAGTTRGIDVGDAEQDALNGDCRRRPHARQQSSQDHSTEDDLLDHRCRDHRDDHDRHDVGGAPSAVAVVDVAGDRHVEQEQQRRQHDLDPDRREVRRRSTPEVSPTELPSDRSKPSIGPSAEHVPAPHQRRAVPHHHRHDQVGRAVGVGEQSDHRATEDQRHQQHQQCADSGGQRELLMRWSPLEDGRRRGPGAPVEVAHPRAARVGVPAGGSGSRRGQ
jgi:hypothetical protein